MQAETPQIEERGDRDADFEQGAQGTFTQKLDYYKRNYRLSVMLKRTRIGIEDQLRKLGYGGAKKSQEQARKRKKVEELEVERRRRFENRK